MVTQGIVLGHIVSKKGIEVDKAKVELISNLPTPNCVKDIRSCHSLSLVQFACQGRPLCMVIGL